MAQQGYDKHNGKMYIGIACLVAALILGIIIFSYQSGSCNSEPSVQCSETTWGEIGVEIILIVLLLIGMYLVVSVAVIRSASAKLLDVSMQEAVNVINKEGSGTAYNYTKDAYSSGKQGYNQAADQARIAYEYSKKQYNKQIKNKPAAAPTNADSDTDSD